MDVEDFQFDFPAPDDSDLDEISIETEINPLPPEPIIGGTTKDLEYFKHFKRESF